MNPLKTFIAISTLMIIGLGVFPFDLNAQSDQLNALRGVELYRQKKFIQAIPHLRRAWQVDKKNLAIGHYLALCLIRLEHYKEGRKILKILVHKEPNNQRFVFDLGLAYLREGNSFWATRYLSKTLKKDPNNERIKYYLALSLLRSGEAKRAAILLEEIKDKKHQNAPLRLQRALAYYLDQRWEDARFELSGLTKGRIGRLANRLMRDSYMAEGKPASLLSFDLSVGFALDSNPLYENETTAPTAIGPSFSVGLIIRPWVDRLNFLWTEASVQRVSYYPLSSVDETMTDPSDGSFTDMRFGLFYARRIAPRYHDLELSIGYRFYLSFLDGDPPLVDFNHIFTEAHGLISALSFVGSSSQTQIRLATTYNRYALIARNSKNIDLALEQSRALNHGLRVLGWIGGRADFAQAKRYHALNINAGLGLSWNAPWKLVFGTRGTWSYSDYYSSEEDYADQGGIRRDHNIGWMLEAGRNLFWGIQLRAVYRFMRNFSTVESFDYGRHLFTFDLNWSAS